MRILEYAKVFSLDHVMQYYYNNQKGFSEYESTCEFGLCLCINQIKTNLEGKQLGFGIVEHRVQLRPSNQLVTMHFYLYSYAYCFRFLSVFERSF